MIVGVCWRYSYTRSASMQFHFKKTLHSAVFTPETGKLSKFDWTVLVSAHLPPHSPDPPPSKKPFSSNPLFKSRNLLKPNITQPTEPPITNPSSCKPRDGCCSAVGSGDRSRSWCRCRDPSSLPELWKETIGYGESWFINPGEGFKRDV